MTVLHRNGHIFWWHTIGPGRSRQEGSMTVPLYIAAGILDAAVSLYLAWRYREGGAQISGGRVLRILGHFVLSLSP
jgi:hypothetical protein